MNDRLDASELPTGWAVRLRRYGCDIDMLKSVLAGLYDAGKVRPQRQDVFRAFQLTPLDEVRVVILGQDPYPSPHEAHGLAFSVPDALPPPRSLKAIFRNLENDERVRFNTPAAGDLTPWAKNGVLLLNTALTVEQGAPGSHAGSWNAFTDAVLKAIVAERPHVAFLLWGTHAIRTGASVPIEEPRHKVVRSSHPAAWGRTSELKFRDTSPFSEADDFLARHDLGTVPWESLALAE